MSSLSDLTILYVEDNLDMQENMKIILADEVKEFYKAYDGKEGLAIYKKRAIDVVIADIDMPEMDGLDMSRAIKEINNKQHIIIISASVEPKIIKLSKDIGVDCFINKPISDLRNLFTILEKIANNLE